MASNPFRNLPQITLQERTASNPFQNLPQDMITEILLRVPVKSLRRFRCVSKSWLSLISSHEFTITYQQVSTSNRQKLICGSWSDSLYISSLRSAFDDHPSVEHAPLDFSTHHPRDKVRIVGSCNGLVCLVFLITGYIIVWNPATRKHRQLPFTFRPLFWNRYAFGYDPSSDDYKVVHITHAYDGHRSSYRTYSLRNHRWKPFSDWPHGTTLAHSGACVNGAVHWIVRRDGRDMDRDVVAQSLATETCTSVELPMHQDGRRITPAILGVSGERLFVCLDDGFTMHIWAMEEYGVKESWTEVACTPLLYNYRFTIGGLIDIDRFLLKKIDPKAMSSIRFQHWEIFIQLSSPYWEAKPSSYAESFVDPSTFGGLP